MTTEGEDQDVEPWKCETIESVEKGVSVRWMIFGNISLLFFLKRSNIVSCFAAMFVHLLAIALLGISVSANQQPKRQVTDAAQFTSAADQLISQYLPSTALPPPLESAVSSAAKAAQVSGDPLSLIYEALLSSSVPSWFSSAIPSGKKPDPFLVLLYGCKSEKIDLSLEQLAS